MLKKFIKIVVKEFSNLGQNVLIKSEKSGKPGKVLGFSEEEEENNEMNNDAVEIGHIFHYY